jgi:hypothetical protein
VSDVAVMVGGNGMGHVYLRGSGWNRDESGDERLARVPGVLDDLLAEAAVDLVAYRPGRDGAVRVVSRRGRALVRLTADDLFYTVETTDPFGFGPLPARMSRTDALVHTRDTEYPDGLVQIAQIFGASRAGDLVVTAARGWDLKLRGEHRLHRSGHGSLHREHMAVPFAMNAPFDKRAARTVDAFPTILHYLGESIPHGVDGRLLVDAPSSAQSAAS